jgi:hypothetical protein
MIGLQAVEAALKSEAKQEQPGEAEDDLKVR